jgi:hypothetical protein
MQQKPLIVRVVMSEDWSATFRLVWMETFRATAAAMGATSSDVDIVVGNIPSWSERRAICLRIGRRCAEDHDLPEMACAWTALAIDPSWPTQDEPAPEPERAKMFLPVNFAFGDAIGEYPSLLDDLDFARAVMGWRFMEAFGVGGPEEDPITVGRSIAIGMHVDGEELFRWALKWREAT